jgi:hypothetical protein
MNISDIKVGTELCKIHSYNKSKSYYFYKVVRKTPKQIVLCNGVKLKIDNGKLVTVGNSEWYLEYEIATEKHKELDKRNKYEYEINAWFQNKKFSIEEIEQIYNLLNGK